jgi:hypothetical protein
LEIFTDASHKNIKIIEVAFEHPKDEGIVKSFVVVDNQVSKGGHLFEPCQIPATNNPVFGKHQKSIPVTRGFSEMFVGNDVLCRVNTRFHKNMKGSFDEATGAQVGLVDFPGDVGRVSQQPNVGDNVNENTFQQDPINQFPLPS